MTDPKLAHRIEMTGWSTVLLGAVCIALAAIQAAAPPVLRRLAATLDGVEDTTRALREAWSAGAGTSAVVNGVFGVALIAIGFGVARRARWAHPALEVACWASIAVLAMLAKPTLAPFYAMVGESSATRLGMLCTEAGLLLAQVGAVLWFLRFWRRDEVRAAFR